jgi:hypothetical protein
MLGPIVSMSGFARCCAPHIQIPVDTLFQQLGWPRQNCASDIILLKELAAIRQRTLADRYPTEA